MRRLLYYLSSGHRTESHIPHLSLSHSLPLSASLCFVSVSHKRLLLFSAIPSRLFSLVFHPSGVRVCCYFHLSVTAARRASHRFPSSVHSSSAPFWTPFPPLLPLFSVPLWLCLPLSHPLLLLWIHAFHVGTFFILLSEL